MFLHIKKAKYQGDYKIEVMFSDDRVGMIDLIDALNGPIFEPLRDPREFARFAVDPELNTIVWANGADFAPEYLYFRAFRDEATLQPLFKSQGYL